MSRLHLLATLTLLVPLTAHAGGLTADDVARAVDRRAPALAARHAEVEAADAGVDQARAGYLPRVNLTARYVRLSDITPPELAPGFAFPVLLNSSTLSAQLVVPLSDDVVRVSRAVAGARHTAEAARLTEAADRRRAIAEARLAYYAWARATLSAQVAADAVAQIDQHLTDVQARAAVERASKADVLRVESQRAAAEQLAIRAADQAAVAEAQLRVLLGDAAGTAPLAIGEDLSSDLALPDPGDAAALAAQAIARRPELRALTSTAAALGAQAAATRAAALPRLDLVGEVVAADPNPRYVPATDALHTTWSAGAQLTWALGDAPANLAAARGLRARARAAEAQRAALADALHVEVAQAVAAIRDAAGAQRTSARGLAAAEESYRVRAALFREGVATSTELTDAEQDLTRARLDAVAARLDARIAAVRLAYATGGQ